MHATLTRRSLIASAIAACATRGQTAPRPYTLMAERSTVNFGFTLSGAAQAGTLPLQSADIRVDPNNLAASRADVTADVRQARTGIVFVTQALLSESVLDAQRHPIVSFKTNAIRLGERGRISEGARIDGLLTLRGVTQPISMDAQLSRPAGSSPDDLSVLYVTLNGVLDRNAFGASGFPDLVDDTVTLDIRAEIRATG